MFRNLLSRLLTDEPDAGTLASGDADLAVAALLVRMARADDRYSEREQHLIDRVLAQRRGLAVDEAADHRAAAEMIEAEAPDTGWLMQRVRHCVRLEDRRGVVEAMWQLVNGASEPDNDEESLVRLAEGIMIADGDDGSPNGSPDGSPDPGGRRPVLTMPDAS